MFVDVCCCFFNLVDDLCIYLHLMLVVKFIQVYKLFYLGGRGINAALFLGMEFQGYLGNI